MFRIRIRDHFITKRALAREKGELKDIVVKQDAEILELRANLKDAAATTDTRIEFMQRAVHGLRRSVQAEYRLRIAAEERMAAVVAELHKLRDEIRDAEQEQPVGIHPNLPSATGAGMARPPRPRFDRTAARLRQQGVPADLVEAIDEETAMKRRLDGLGDPA